MLEEGHKGDIEGERDMGYCGMKNVRGARGLFLFWGC